MKDLNKYLEEQKWKLHYLKAVKGIFALNDNVSEQMAKDWMQSEGFEGEEYSPFQVIMLGDGAKVVNYVIDNFVDTEALG